MFGWFRRTKAKDPVCIYDLRDRLIYEYFDGQKIVKADPMYLYRKIMSVGAALSIDMKVATSQSKDAQQGHESALLKLREIFQVKSFVDGGLTEVETIDLLNHFMNFTEDIKKKSKMYATSPNNMESSPAILEQPSPPTPSTSPSGSVVNESTSEEQTSLPTATP